jgi:putative nucleotidyltransferase with HDIG domain
VIVGRVAALKIVAAGLLAATLLGATLTTRASDWHPVWLFLTLMATGVLGDRVSAQTGRMRLSAGLTVVGLAMALLGPAPAIAICFVSRVIDAVIADGVRLQGRRLALAWNLAMVLGSVLAGSLIIRGAADSGLARGSAGYALVVVGALCVANLINFVLAAIWIRARSGASVAHQLRHNFLPALPWLAAPNLMAGALVIVYVRVGPTSLLLLLALLAAFYVLLAELLNSQQRRNELEERTVQLASLQVGVLVTMVRTLSLRDKFTARHSAAVARYAHAIARAAGCSADELRTVHTAGLLHDIGKFAFPDRILFADGGLSADDLALVREHPVSGAELVRSVEGLEEIAAVILAHHEQVDGSGYPLGLRGDRIPALARMISVADVYDVITSRDTYRTPVSRTEAIAELQRVAGTQLDAEYVRLFIDVLEHDRLDFAHNRAADFEAELEIEQKIRELAAPRPASAGAGR